MAAVPAPFVYVLAVFTSNPRNGSAFAFPSRPRERAMLVSARPWLSGDSSVS